MKKVTFLVLLCLVFASMTAFAETVPPPDGVDVVIGSTKILHDMSDYYTDNDAPRTIASTAVGKQEAALKLQIKALIPCYLEFNFSGNNINVSMESFGAGAKAQANLSDTQGYIGFYPAIGGFIDSDWGTVEDSSSANAEVAPDEGMYIRGCDTFKSEIWSNLNWTYGVNLVGAEGLVLSGWAKPLPVDMRYVYGEDAPDFDATTGWTGQIRLSSAVQSIAAGTATNGGTIWQQLRVPYTEEFKAGHYTGQILFTAATI